MTPPAGLAGQRRLPLGAEVQGLESHRGRMESVPRRFDMLAGLLVVLAVWSAAIALVL